MLQGPGREHVFQDSRACAWFVGCNERVLCNEEAVASSTGRCANRVFGTWKPPITARSPRGVRNTAYTLDESLTSNLPESCSRRHKLDVWATHVCSREAARRRRTCRTLPGQSKVLCGRGRERQRLPEGRESTCRSQRLGSGAVCGSSGTVGVVPRPLQGPDWSDYRGDVGRWCVDCSSYLHCKRMPVVAALSPAARSEPDAKGCPAVSLSQSMHSCRR
jgi:hypothetical protein